MTAKTTKQFQYEINTKKEQWLFIDVAIVVFGVKK